MDYMKLTDDELLKVIKAARESIEKNGGNLESAIRMAMDAAVSLKQNEQNEQLEQNNLVELRRIALEREANARKMMQGIPTIQVEEEKKEESVEVPTLEPHVLNFDDYNLRSFNDVDLSGIKINDTESMRKNSQYDPNMGSLEGIDLSGIEFRDTKFLLNDFFRSNISDIQSLERLAEKYAVGIDARPVKAALELAKRGVLTLQELQLGASAFGKNHLVDEWMDCIVQINKLAREIYYFHFTFADESELKYQKGEAIRSYDELFREYRKLFIRYSGTDLWQNSQFGYDDALERFAYWSYNVPGVMVDNNGFYVEINPLSYDITYAFAKKQLDEPVEEICDKCRSVIIHTKERIASLSPKDFRDYKIKQMTLNPEEQKTFEEDLNEFIQNYKDKKTGRKI